MAHHADATLTAPAFLIALGEGEVLEGALKKDSAGRNQEVHTMKNLLVGEDRLYAPHESGNANAVHAAVSGLRKRLESAGAGARIAARRRIGYRLVEDGDT